MRTSRGLKEAYRLGAIKSKEIITHFIDSKGTNVMVIGQKGSGKTTLLLTIADAVMYQNSETKQFEKETVIYRGRNSDTWNWLNKDRVVVFVHKKDIKTVTFRDDTRREIPPIELPVIETYVSFNHLLSRLRDGKINVVYEPSEYQLSPNIKKMIAKRGMSEESDMFKNTAAIDPVIFWFEFLHFLTIKKGHKAITIIMDEFDEVCPQTPGGLRWHLNMFFKDVCKDLRKKSISLFCACHSITDFDGRLKSKFPYKIWMRGSITPTGSIVNHTAPVKLQTGHYYIEMAGWGISKCDRIEPKTIINVQLHPEIAEDFWDEAWIDPSELKSLDDPQSTTTLKPSPQPRPVNY